MPKYGLIACFSPVITVEWVNISSTGTGSAKIGSWKMEKKNGVLAIQIKTPVADNIDYVRYINMQN